nr:family 10 glycosylhydrolase [Hoylesella enoeca]
MKKNQLRFISILLLFFICFSNDLQAGAPVRKREFRGTWIQSVNGQFQGMTTAGMQQELTRQLNELKKDGVNAIFFQVRPECDALYQSRFEPWSRFLTGVQGQAPSPYWDPLAWMVTECHKRGMELHAWINPYRAKTKGTTALSPHHIAMRHPERVFSYDGLYILNPGNPLNREYICRIASDIVRHYDVDGLHIDDYFYPYHVAGQVIDDEKEYRQYGGGFKDKGDWRRDNVNRLIRQMHDSIRSVKPWVKFGVSPFGIYRNKQSAPGVGSDTRGTQGYDDLYADVLLWVKNGCVDYCVPQLYWQIGHPTADYKTLISWWNKNASNRPLFIGEDVERTVKFADPANPKSNQMSAKFALRNRMENIEGAVLWYSKAVVDNVGGYGQMLRTYYWRYPALQPRMPFIDHGRPRKPRALAPVWTSDGYFLFWSEPKTPWWAFWLRSRKPNWRDEVTKYVVYCFDDGEEINLDDASKIITITRDTKIRLPYTNGKKHYTYVVTALDRLSNESKGRRKRVEL